MTSDKRSIILISNAEDLSKAVGSALSESEAFDLTLEEGTLARVNGAAVQLANSNDIVLFRLTDETDLAAVRDLRAKIGLERILVAISDQNLSLAEALELRENGIDDILPYPISDAIIRKRLEELLRQKMPAKPEMQNAVARPLRKGQVISVTRARGGIGATTMAVTLADALQDRTGVFRKHVEHRVALVDLDLQFGTVASALDLNASETLFRMAMDGIEPDATFLGQAMVEHASGLHVLTAPPEFAPLDAITKTQVDALISALQNQFDYVVIDLPRTICEWMEPVITRSDKILMMTDSSVPAIRQAFRMLQFIAGERFDPPVEMVVNFEKKPLFFQDHHNEAVKILERPLQHWLPFDPKPAREAQDQGRPLTEIAARAPLTKAIKRLARAVLDEKTQGDVVSLGTE